VLLAGLSTGHEIGLAVTAAVFVGFALFSSFIAPRRWPDYPGQNGLPVFIIISFVLFAAMLTAVEVFGVEEPEGKAEAAAPKGGGELNKTIKVQEKEFRIVLPATGVLPPAQYAFDVENVGKTQHNLVIEGGTLTGAVTTPTIQPGKSAKLTVDLGKGTYTLYCSIDGHRKLGMLASLAVG
jgi:plastocyanin